MKKILGGCLIVGLLALVVGGGATWWLVLRPAWNAGSQLLDAATQLQDLSKLESQVRNRTAFTPPADGRISDDGLNKFLATQRTIKESVGPALSTLEDKYRDMKSDSANSGKTPGATEMMQAYGDLFGLLREAKQAQVDALNAHGLSLAEYRWTREQAYRTLAQESMTQQAAPDDATSPTNAQRLTPHRELLQETIVMAWLGL